VTSFLQYPSK